MGDLTGKIAIITGASSGIGKAIAERYAQAGAKVVIADLSFESAQNVAREISRQGHEAIAVNMDVTKEDEVESGIAYVISTYGGIDILVSNAGMQYISPIDELSYTNWKKLLSVNLDGAFLTTRACLKNMYERGNGGSIIYIGSVYSKAAALLKAPYVASKHALIGLCQVVAKEGAKHGVRANVICPGFVRTPLVEKQIPEQAKSLGISEEDVINKIMLKDTVDGEFTSSENVADVALFFAAGYGKR